MRNGVFIAGVAAAVVGGGLIGWFGDFGALTDAASARPAAAPADPYAPRVDGLDFKVDLTRTKDEPPRSRSGYVPMGDRGWEPNGCAMPRAGDGTRVMMVGVYSGDAVSTVALGSQDEETGVVEVVIESGAEPLYVVLSNFRPTIWRFSGATDRVERAVMVASKGGGAGRVISHPSARNGGAAAAARSARRAADEASRAAREAAGGSGSGRRMTQPTRRYAGIIGLPADRVTTVEDIRCYDYFSHAESLKTTRAAQVVRRATGRAPDVIAGGYSLAAVQLPSARGARGPGRLPAPEGFDRPMWREAVRFNPAGVASIRRETVASAVDVIPYEVLPNQTGLAQLIGSGHIQRSGGELTVVRPIPRLPASMGGAHATTLVLAEGVPVPAGDPVHSCIMRKSTDGGDNTPIHCMF